MTIRKRTFLTLSAAALIASTAMTSLVAAQEGPVVIYTAHKSSIVDTLLPIFEQETGLKAEVVKLGSGDIAKRARAEAGAPAADVIWSISGSQLTELADLLEPYAPPEADKIDPQFVQNPRLDALYGRGLRAGGQYRSAASRQRANDLGGAGRSKVAWPDCQRAR